jgi:putative pyruvate formate lyase activating enzyme
MILYTAFLHQGEEPGISRGSGSGTLFFSGCSLQCRYCQNYAFSHSPNGREITARDLATIMLNLQKKGASNINLVTPTHFLPQILGALGRAFSEGLMIPVVYNTSGYEKKEVIAQIGDVVDIYLVDMRYIDPVLAQKYSGARDYPVFNQESVKEMYRQKQHPVWKGESLTRGCVIRNLVLPGNIGNSKDILSWIQENTPRALVSVMFQYQPYFQSCLYPEINRTLDRSEYLAIRDFVQELGLDGWMQDFQPEECMAGAHFKPGFDDYL